VALICGNVQEEHFNDAHLFDPTIRALTRRIKVKPSTEADKHMPHAMRCYFKLITRSGAQFSTVVDHHKGHWKNPMDDADIERKFRALAKKVLPDAKTDTLLARLWQLHEIRDAGEIAALTKA
jgi:2-methylcitrate dehydratase